MRNGFSNIHLLRISVMSRILGQETSVTQGRAVDTLFYSATRLMYSKTKGNDSSEMKAVLKGISVAEGGGLSQMLLCVCLMLAVVGLVDGPPPLTCPGLSF